MADYSQITDDEFREILTEIVEELPAEQLLSYGGVYDVLKEMFNEEVLDRWAYDNPEKVIPLPDLSKFNVEVEAAKTDGNPFLIIYLGSNSYFHPELFEVAYELLFPEQSCAAEEVVNIVSYHPPVDVEGLLDDLEVVKKPTGHHETLYNILKRAERKGWTDVAFRVKR